MSFCGTTLSYFEKPGNLRIGYVILGKKFLEVGRPLVLVNGLGGILEDWETLALALGKTRCLLLFDNRGMGASKFTSATSNKDITFQTMAEDLLDLIDHLHWPEVDLLGWSMGGVIVQHLLLKTKYEGTVKIPNVILAASTAKMPEGEPGAFPGMIELVATAQAYKGDRTSSEFRSSLRAGVELYFDSEFSKTHDDIIQRWIDRVAPGTKESEILVAQITNAPGIEFISHLPNFPASTRVFTLHGTKDRIVYPKESQPYLALHQCKTLLAGSKPGQVPHLDFGHAWWEYFTAEIWVDVIAGFLDVESTSLVAPAKDEAFSGVAPLRDTGVLVAND